MTSSLGGARWQDALAAGGAGTLRAAEGDRAQWRTLDQTQAGIIQTVAMDGAEEHPFPLGRAAAAGGEQDQNEEERPRH